MKKRSERLPRIGVSACIFHENHLRTTFNGRPLLYVEQSMSDWIMAQGALPFMIPVASGRRPVSVGLRDFIEQCDGLLIQGGVDMSPRSYGEEPLRAEWAGDPVRDAYEIELIRHCVELDVPVLGICRGHQVLNVAMGGSLYQDINHQIPGSLLHRNAEVYEYNRHEIHLAPDSELHRIYAGLDRAMVPSVHHQAVKDLAPGFVIEARSVVDDVVEAIRFDGIDEERYMVGVQWHPEFQDPQDVTLLDTRPLFADFLGAVRRRMEKGEQPVVRGVLNS